MTAEEGAFAGFGSVWSADDLAFLDGRRKAHIRRRDAMLAYQKECAGRGDRGGARFFSAEASDALKRIRACEAALACLRGDRATADVAAEIAPFVRLEVGCMDFKIAAE